MNSGAVIAGLGVVGILAYLFGGEAEASEKHPVDKWVSEDDLLGKAEAEKMGGIIAAALSKCKDVHIGPEGVPSVEGGTLGGCDVKALQDAAWQLRSTKWKHKQVALAAAEEADKLDALASDAKQVQQAYHEEASYLATTVQNGNCSQLSKTCVNTLYGAAHKLETYPWQTQVKGEALNVAHNLRAKAKDIEDALQAQKEANYP